MTMRLYLDAAPVIYVVEQVKPYAAVVDAQLSDSATVVVVSDLTRMECRVKPLRDGNTDLLRDFDDFFAKVAEIISLAREVIDHATLIRARHGFKMPDAIHLASAIVSGCDIFLTNDHR